MYCLIFYRTYYDAENVLHYDCDYRFCNSIFALNSTVVTLFWKQPWNKLCEVFKVSDKPAQACLYHYFEKRIDILRNI